MSNFVHQVVMWFAPLPNPSHRPLLSVGEGDTHIFAFATSSTPTRTCAP